MGNRPHRACRFTTLATDHAVLGIDYIWLPVHFRVHALFAEIYAGKAGYAFACVDGGIPIDFIARDAVPDFFATGFFSHVFKI
jgi:hypothetical protein